MTNRRILRLRGADTFDFLQNLVTNDVAGVKTGVVYTALLTPQGKYIADFFLVPDPDEGDAPQLLLDVAEELGDMLVQRLSMYKLRAAVSLEKTELHLHRGIGDPPDDGFDDPRTPALGWRAYRDTPQQQDQIDWEAIRVAHLIPETGIELTADTFILEAGFERLKGVDFRKGCYVGQEVTARMKHKTELRKGLARVDINGAAPVGTDVMRAGKPVGTLFTQSGGQGIAYLRFDRATGEMTADTATLEWSK